jgi:hypothetical protein
MPLKPWDPFPDINMLQASMGMVLGLDWRGGDGAGGGVCI